jgi:hypothetical protein
VDGSACGQRLLAPGDAAAVAASAGAGAGAGVQTSAGSGERRGADHAELISSGMVDMAQLAIAPADVDGIDHG